MFAKLRSRLTYANVVSTICLVLVVGGSSAYAAATITGADVVNDSLTGEDVQGRGGSAPVNGSLTSGDIGGQAANPATGTPFVEGSLTQWDIKNGTLGSDDVANDSLTGADIDESSLAGGLPATSRFGVILGFNGGRAYGRGITNSQRFETGHYRVVFDRPVTGCVAVATPGESFPSRVGDSDSLNPPGIKVIPPPSGAPNAVDVRTQFGTTPIDQSFHIALFC
jgi:hypothetical protein